MNVKAYSGVSRLPSGNAPDTVVGGCIVLEGGAFRGVYTSGVLDALMQQGVNLQCTVGCSAGALNGLNYVAGQIGRSARINLGYLFFHGTYVWREVFPRTVPQTVDKITECSNAGGIVRRETA